MKRDLHYHLKAAAAGAAIGIALTVIVHIATGRGERLATHVPLWLSYSAAMGAIWALSFLVLCIQPLDWVRRTAAAYPPKLRNTLIASTAAIGGSLAPSVALWLCSLLPGLTLSYPIPVWVILLADGILAAILALAMAGFAMVKQSTAAREFHEKAALSARAWALQAQINPHFFFNTLNTISSLIESRPAEAKELIARMADLFRYTLHSGQDGMANLAGELDFVRDYLAIEQARFGPRLKFELPANAPEIRLPGLTLQPIVENAVRYGVAPCIDGGVIQIAVTEQNSEVRVTVRNQGCEKPDLTEANLFRSGHALANVRDRLRLQLGDRATLRIQPDGPTGVLATITLPRDPRS